MNGEVGSHNKAKGVKHQIAADFRTKDYEHCRLNPKESIVRKQHLLRSELHNIITIEQEKIALNAADDKRFIRKDKIRTYALGHMNIPNESDTSTDSESDPDAIEIEELENSFMNTE